MNKEKFIGNKKVRVNERLNCLRVPKIITEKLYNTTELQFVAKKMYFVKIDEKLPLYRYVVNFDEFEPKDMIELNYTKDNYIFCRKLNPEKYKYCLFHGYGDYFTIWFTND